MDVGRDQRGDEEEDVLSDSISVCMLCQMGKVGSLVAPSLLIVKLIAILVN